MLLPTVNLEPSARLANVPAMAPPEVFLITVKTVPIGIARFPIAMNEKIASLLIETPLALIWSERFVVVSFHRKQPSKSQRWTILLSFLDQRGRVKAGRSACPAENIALL